MREADLLERIGKLFPRAGDDAAVIGRQVITNDMLIEDVDFTRAMPLHFIARKSLAANLSDLAAMGSRPMYGIVALGLPGWVDAERLVEEFAAAASEQRIEIIGGDVSRADKLIVSVTAIGETDRPLLRSGAQPGDRIYVSRPIGASMAGLFLLQHGFDFDGKATDGRPLTYGEREFVASAIRRHVDPEPEVELGMKLAAMPQVTSCIDVSDGLSTDLHHLCAASHAGADIEHERIPVFPDLAAAALRFGIDVPQCVLHGGEEYALIFTSSLRESELSFRVGRPVYAIGRVSRDPGVRLDGVPLEALGWDHFAHHPTSC
jgi:thiamine-monophosphate kinase